MFEKVKEQLDEIISIAEKCPEKYQEKCFEVLLSSLARAEAPSVLTPPGAPAVPKAEFFSRFNISQEEWTRVFHFGEGVYSIIVGDLKVKPKAGKQVRLALLLGVKSLLETGKPDISKDTLVEVCEKYSAYDSSNFASYMKKKKDLFLPKGDGWILTIPGQEQAAEVIKELAQ